LEKTAKRNAEKRSPEYARGKTLENYQIMRKIQIAFGYFILALVLVSLCFTVMVIAENEKEFLSSVTFQVAATISVLITITIGYYGQQYCRGIFSQQIPLSILLILVFIISAGIGAYYVMPFYDESIAEPLHQGFLGVTVFTIFLVPVWGVPFLLLTKYGKFPR